MLEAHVHLNTPEPDSDPHYLYGLASLVDNAFSEPDYPVATNSGDTQDLDRGPLDQTWAPDSLSSDMYTDSALPSWNIDQRLDDGQITEQADPRCWRCQMLLLEYGLCPYCESVELASDSTAGEFQGSTFRKRQRRQGSLHPVEPASQDQERTSNQQESFDGERRTERDPSGHFGTQSDQYAANTDPLHSLLTGTTYDLGQNLLEDNNEHSSTPDRRCSFIVQGGEPPSREQEGSNNIHQRLDPSSARPSSFQEEGSGIDYAQGTSFLPDRLVEPALRDSTGSMSNAQGCPDTRNDDIQNTRCPNCFTQRELFLQVDSEGNMLCKACGFCNFERDDPGLLRGRSVDRSPFTNVNRSGSNGSASSCGSCSKIFSRPDVRKRHEDAVHSKGRRVICGGPSFGWGCGKTYKNMRSLKDHWSRVSKDGTGISCSRRRDELNFDELNPSNHANHGGIPVPSVRRKSLIVFSHGTEARNDPLDVEDTYPEDYYRCPHRNTGVCTHKPTKLKHEHDKYLDDHVNRPFVCQKPTCIGSDERFATSVDLIRHEEQVHPRLHLVLFGWLSSLCDATEDIDPTGPPKLPPIPPPPTNASAINIARHVLEYVNALKSRNKELETRTRELGIRNRELETRNEKLEIKLGRLETQMSLLKLKIGISNIRHGGGSACGESLDNSPTQEGSWTRLAPC